MERDWRSIQFFLSESGVYEVEADMDNEGLRCNCRAYALKNLCKHVRFVSNKTDANNGVYPVKVSSKITEQQALTAQRSAENFRDFLIKYGRVEVV